MSWAITGPWSVAKAETGVWGVHETRNKSNYRLSIVQQNLAALVPRDLCDLKDRYRRKLESVVPYKLLATP